MQFKNNTKVQKSGSRWVKRGNTRTEITSCICTDSSRWHRAPPFNLLDYVRLPPHFLSFPMISGYYYVCRLKTPNLSSNMLRHLTSTMAALGTGSIVPIVHSTVRYYYPLVTGKAAHGRAHLLWDWVGTHTQATSQ